MTWPLVALTLAFGVPDDFAASALQGGGGGVRFTGGPSAPWDCGVCHESEVEHVVRLVTPDRDLPGQGYVPGERYELELVSEGGEPQRSAFSLEVAAAGGEPAGTLAPAPALAGTAALPYLCASQDPVVVAEGRVAQAYSCGIRRWRVSWQAPDTDVGAVTVYASVVDANDDSRNTGDVSTSVSLGIPSPASLARRPAGCGAAGDAGSLLALGAAAVALLRRRRGAALLVALLCVGSVSEAAGKKTRKGTPRLPPPVAPAPAPVPVPEPPPVAEPPAAAAQPPVPLPAPAPVPEPEAPSAPSVAAAPAAPEVLAPAALEVDAQLGYGMRALSLSSASYGTPVGLSFGYPSLGFSLTVYPLRLLRTGVLEGLQLGGAYAVGWVLQPTTLGSTLVLPSDGVVSAGYLFRAGPVELAPRVVYRVVIGGVEKNALFDDGYFQSVGGELRVALRVGAFSAHVTPRGGTLVDVGTLMPRAYGASTGGTSWGGTAGVALRLGSAVELSARYQLTVTRAGFAGRGERSLEALTLADVVHVGTLGLTLER